MKKLNLSKFDLGMIIAFVVIGLLGGGGWYYLSGQLSVAQQGVTAAKEKFDQYSSYQGSTQKILVSRGNQKILQANIDLLKGAITPLIQNKLMSKEESQLDSFEKKDPVEDPVDWKHDLDNKVRDLTAAAAVHSVKLPNGFYFTFSRYLNQNPADDKTVVLNKQLLAVEQLATILLNAPVKSITSIRRSYEEEAPGAASPSPSSGTTETDRLAYSSVEADGGAYRSYPFEVDFETNTVGFLKITNDLIKSPYIFVLRTLSVQNEQSTSPAPAELEKMAGTTDPSVINTSPGEVASTVSTKGPQYLFGGQILHIKARIDLIDWVAPAPDEPAK